VAKGDAGRFAKVGECADKHVVPHALPHGALTNDDVARSRRRGAQLLLQARQQLRDKEIFVGVVSAGAALTVVPMRSSLGRWEVVRRVIVAGSLARHGRRRV